MTGLISKYSTIVMFENLVILGLFDNVKVEVSYPDLPSPVSHI